MTRRKKLARVNKVAIAEAAWRLAYLENTSFNTQGLAARLHMPPNRHFRQYLNSLGASGLLAVTRRLYDDGKYRKVFYAQQTEPLFDAHGEELIA